MPAWQSFKASHVSAPLHHNPSLHKALFGILLQESVASLHESSVHPILSLQFIGVPGSHVRVAPLHVSAPLQYKPSSHSESRPEGQPQPELSASHILRTSLQKSDVHAMPSSHTGGVPDWQSRIELHVSSPLFSRFALYELTNF